MISVFILLAANAFAIEYEEQDSFFVDLEKNLINEYRLCTGDERTTDLDSLIRWKKSITLRTEIPGYKKILKEFILHTGMVKEVLPCQVLKWHLDRMKYLRNREDSLNKALLKKSDYSVDSIRVHLELKNNPVSPFDFESIPFGLSKKVFKNVFTTRLSYPLIDKRSYLLVEHFPIKDTPFLVKFHFTRDKRYYKYEVEGYSFSGDSLNKVVRPQATLLKEIMEQKIGPPDHIYRIGYFDIKSGILTPYAKWERETHSTVIGLSIKDIRYFTRETVTNKKISDKTKSVLK